jgi:hypothetical protein
MSNPPNQPRSGLPLNSPGHVGHAHFWERFQSRRQFFGTAAGVAGAVGAGLWLPASAWADKKLVDPKPIPGTTTTPFGKIHFFFPGPADKGNEPSLITDFNGFIGVIDAVGSGTGTDTTTNKKVRLRYAVDNRFMSGVYVGVDGKTHHGTFVFV